MIYEILSGFWVMQYGIHNYIVRSNTLLFSPFCQPCCRYFRTRPVSKSCRIERDTAARNKSTQAVTHSPGEDRQHKN